MGSDSVLELLHLFHKRHDIFECLSEGHLDKRTVEGRVDASRPTIDRAYRELEGAGILTSTGTTYELTSFGALCCTEFESVTESLGTLSELEDVLSYLPKDTGVDMRLLQGASVHYAEDHAPQEPLMEVVNVAAAASEIAGYSSTITPHYVDAFHALVVEQGTPATLVFTENVVETGLDNYSERFGAIVEASHATVYATERVLTYGAAISDDSVAVPVGDELDRLQAVLVNDTDAALDWADEFIEDLVTDDRTTTVTANA